MTDRSPGNERGLFMARVTKRRELCREHYEVSLNVDAFPAAEPGQFVQVLCHDPADDACKTTESLDSDRFSHVVQTPMLRRPFSIAGLRRDASTCEIDLIGRVIGPGTAWLGHVSEGNCVELLGPLGRPFRFPAPGAHAILVAGGVGLPPIRWLSERLARAGYACTAIFGAQSHDLIPLWLIKQPSNDGTPTICAAEFAYEGVPVSITTDDGSCGLRGRVTDSLARLIDARRGAAVQVHACGPEGMLNAVGAMCLQREIDCQLALERIMGCGMGTCQSCVVPVRDDQTAKRWRYALCCTEGPVFEARQLLFDRA